MSAWRQTEVHNKRTTAYAALFLLAAAVVVTLISSAPAASASEKRWAVVIGINNYLKEITPLTCAVNDAKAFKETISLYGGFQEDNIFLLTSDARGNRVPDKASIVRWISYIKQNAGPDDVVFFFFSGQGMNLGNQSYLLTVEADPYSRETIDASALKVSDLMKYMEQIKARKKILFIDACRNEPRSGKGDKDNPLTRDFAQSFKTEITVTFFSCRVGQRSYEWSEKSMGFFTYFLVKGLRGSAANREGNVTVSSLEKYLMETVPETVKREQGNEQEPWPLLEGTAGSGEYSLMRPSHSGKVPSTSVEDTKPHTSRPSHPVVEVNIEADDLQVKSFLKAICADDAGKVRQFIAASRGLMRKCDKNGVTPLCWAAMLGYRDMVELLFKEGANPSWGDLYGRSPLTYAVSAGQKDMVLFLISKGSDINSRDQNGNSPLHAAGFSESDMASVSEAAAVLIDRGADIRIRNNDGYEPLHCAAARGQTGVAALLIKKGAAVNSRTSQGKTPLAIAREKGRQAMVDMLQKAGAKE